MGLKFNPFRWGTKNKNNPQLEQDVNDLKQRVIQLEQDYANLNQFSNQQAAKITQLEATLNRVDNFLNTTSAELVNVRNQCDGNTGAIDQLENQTIPGLTNRLNTLEQAPAIRDANQIAWLNKPNTFQGGLTFNGGVVTTQNFLFKENADIVKECRDNQPEFNFIKIVNAANTSQIRFRLAYDPRNLLVMLKTLHIQSRIDVNKQRFPNQ